MSLVSSCVTSPTMKPIEPSLFFVIFVILLFSLLALYHWDRRKLYLFAAKVQGPPALPLVGNGLMFLCKKEGKKLCLFRENLGEDRIADHVYNRNKSFCLMQFAIFFLLFIKAIAIDFIQLGDICS